MVLPQKSLFAGALPLGFESTYAAVPNRVHPSLGQTCRQSRWHQKGNTFSYVWQLIPIQSAKFITLCAEKGLQRERVCPYHVDGANGTQLTGRLNW